METANGEILAGETIGMELEAIGEQEIRPYVLQDSPDLISIGRRCQEMGYTFHWSLGSKSPYFVLPGSEQKVHLQTMGYIPYLVDKAQHGGSVWTSSGLCAPCPRASVIVDGTWSRSWDGIGASGC